jgi:thiamine-monophosphate kinase
LAAALNEGEDFELLFTLAADQWEKLRSQWRDPLPITAVGRVTDSRGMKIRMPDGRVVDLEPGGYEHLTG